MTKYPKYPSLLTSHYGSVTIEWELEVLAKVLAGLECEREQA